MSAFDLVAHPEVREYLEYLAHQQGQKAFERQGAEAFSMPRSHAVAHEVGHAILYRVEGLPVTSIKVYEKRAEARLRFERLFKKAKKSGQPMDPNRYRQMIRLPKWQGWCHSGPEGKKAGAYKPGDSFEHACRCVRLMIAGACGEAVFGNGDLRGASSLDETVTAQIVAADHGGENLWKCLWAETMTILRENDDAARSLIRAFGRADTLDGERLQKLLAAVKMREQMGERYQRFLQIRAATGLH